MSLVEYYDGLAEIAIGWLGWSEEEALAADVNAIAVGYAGKMDMLKMCFGSSEEAPAKKEPAPKVAARPMTFELFDALFGVKG